MLTRQTQNISITFVQRRANVFNVGTTLYKCYVLCLLGTFQKYTLAEKVDETTPCGTCILLGEISWQSPNHSVQI